MASCSHFSKEATDGATFRLAADAEALKPTAMTAAIANVMMRIISSLLYLSPLQRAVSATQPERNLNRITTLWANELRAAHIPPRCTSEKKRRRRIVGGGARGGRGTPSHRGAAVTMAVSGFLTRTLKSITRQRYIGSIWGTLQLKLSH